MPSAIGSFAEQPHAPPTPPQPAPALLRPLAPPPPPAPAWADVPLQLALFELPEPLQDVILGHLGLGDLATASCASLAFAALCRVRGQAGRAGSGRSMWPGLRSTGCLHADTAKGSGLPAAHPACTGPVELQRTRLLQARCLAMNLCWCTRHPAPRKYLLQRALELKREVAASTDLRLLPRQLNLLLLGAGGASGAASHRLHRRSLAYVPAALHYIRWLLCD